MNFYRFFLIAVVFFINSFVTIAQEIPETNKKIIEYVNTVIGQKVDRGECWDLASKAMSFSKAKWTPPKIFGKIVDFKKDDVFEGDIIFFENVVIKIENETQTFPHHYAVIYKVLEKGKFQIAEQNSNGVKKVAIHDLDLNHKTKGKIVIYRPGT